MDSLQVQGGSLFGSLHFVILSIQHFRSIAGSMLHKLRIFMCRKAEYQASMSGIALWVLDVKYLRVSVLRESIRTILFAISQRQSTFKGEISFLEEDWKHSKVYGKS